MVRYVTDMAGAFGWGLLAASSLVIGAVLALAFRIPKPLIGFIMAFGAGVLISAVAFDLVEEAVDSTNHDWVAFVGISTGCVVYALANWRVNQLGGSRRKDASHVHQEDDALGIVLGSVLDGIPESLVIGLTIARGGGIGAAYLAAVFISNLPEAISATSGFRSTWSAWRILRMWILIALVSGAASLFGYAFFDGTSDEALAFVLTFAAGAILTMLADTMMPEAFNFEVSDSKRRSAVGVATTLGFALAFALHQIS
jgi:zinc transporter, ZIP family